MGGRRCTQTEEVRWYLPKSIYTRGSQPHSDPTHRQWYGLTMINVFPAFLMQISPRFSTFNVLHKARPIGDTTLLLPIPQLSNCLILQQRKIRGSLLEIAGHYQAHYSSYTAVPRLPTYCTIVAVLSKTAQARHLHCTTSQLSAGAATCTGE